MNHIQLRQRSSLLPLCGLLLLLVRPSLAADNPPARGPEAAQAEVSIFPGQNIQAAVDAHPAGTTFRIQTGIHRLQQVRPKDGDGFIGEPGAVLCGAKVLPAADFAKTGTAWYIGGQTQRLPQPFGPDIMIPGYESDLNSEEVFVNGDTRLKRVAALSDLGPGRWFFDYTAGRIYLHDDPASFSLIETSAASAAFGGSEIRKVLLENLVIEKYGNPPNHGAVGSLGSTDSRFTYDWTCRYLTVRFNHGDGIDTGPGMTVEHCRLHDNGQFGVGGSGVDERSYWSSPSTAYKGKVTFRNNEVFRNGVLGYQRGWGAGGSKFAVQAAGTLVENCWFHDNYGPGIWFDIDNRDTEIRSNLVESNGITRMDKIGGLGRGIFYEVSFGPAKIYWNVSRNNQETAIFNSNSEGVEIYENTVYPNGIIVSHDNRGHQTSSRVHHNDIGRGGLAKGNGLAMAVSSAGGLQDALPRATIDANTYRGFDAGTKYWWAGTLWSSGASTFSEWQRFGFDNNGRLLDTGTPALPNNAVAFALSHYGQREKVPAPTGSPRPSARAEPATVPLWGRFETAATHTRNYANPFTDVRRTAFSYQMSDDFAGTRSVRAPPERGQNHRGCRRQQSILETPRLQRRPEPALGSACAEASAGRGRRAGGNPASHPVLLALSLFPGAHDRSDLGGEGALQDGGQSAGAIPRTRRHAPRHGTCPWTDVRGNAPRPPTRLPKSRRARISPLNWRSIP